MTDGLERLEKFFQNGSKIKLTNGQILIYPDKEPKGIYLLISGFIRSYNLTENGDEKLHVILKTGEVFPLMWAVTDIQKPLWYEALGPSEVWMIPKSAFRELISTNPTATSQILLSVLNQYQILSDRIDNLEYPKASSRVIARIISLAARFGIKKNGGILISAPVTHRDIAHSVAVTRETASRELERLAAKNLLSYQDRLIFIPDLPLLQKELQNSIGL